MTADTHLNHEAVIGYEGRKFSDAAEMDEYIIQRWNAAVRPTDHVLHLGDVAMGIRTRLADYVRRLNGTIILQPGNHDYKRDDQYFRHVQPRKQQSVLTVGDLAFELVHRPQDATYRCPLVLCGHVHQAWREQTRQHNPTWERPRLHPTIPIRLFNVGVDVRDFRPVPVEEIVRWAGTEAG